jgi:cell division protein FtsI/penicillin-binding protein 2
MRWMARAAIVLAMVCGVSLAGAEPGSSTAQRALDKALSGTSAVGVVLDGRDGRLAAAVREPDAGRVATAPGSTLKPLFLMAALREGRVRPETTVVCHGDLRIAGRDVACTHPREQNVFDAERALAYSCNTWFASLARRFSPEEAAEVLRSYGFGSRTRLASGDAAGDVQVPRNNAEVQLLVLGLGDIRVTPLQLVRAYFRLAHENMMPVVWRGLEGSVAYGMAHNAATPGITIVGKTGTARDEGESWTHGWFAGIASRGAERVVVVVYVPRGNGADAAALAHRFFVAWGRTS